MMESLTSDVLLEAQQVITRLANVTSVLDMARSIAEFVPYLSISVQAAVYCLARNIQSPPSRSASRSADPRLRSERPPLRSRTESLCETT